MYTTNINHTQGNIPFSWENRPGVRKDDQENLVGEGWKMVVHDNLSAKDESLPPPPPCEDAKNTNKTNSHDIGLPFPPCGFQTPKRSSSRKSKDLDDPFIIAYKECTKSNKKGTLTSKKSLLGSCKYSCSVRDDSIVKVAHIPLSNSDRKKFDVVKHQG